MTLIAGRETDNEVSQEVRVKTEGVSRSMPDGDIDGQDSQQAAGTPVYKRGNGETILIVEDDNEVRSIVSILLSRLGYQIWQADNASTGLEIFAQNPNITAIYADVDLPGGPSGIDLAKSCRELRHDVPIIFTSGHAPDGFIHAIGEIENAPLLKKPIDFKVLSRILRHMLVSTASDQNHATVTALV